MAKLVDVYRTEKHTTLMRRQLPLVVDDNLTMVMDLSSAWLSWDNTTVKGKELDQFVRKLNLLTKEELKKAFKIPCADLLTVLNQAVPCIGCRRSVERQFYHLMRSGYPALDPLVITGDGNISIKEEQLDLPQVLCTLLNGHRARLNSLVENQPRSKKSRRCTLHCLDSQRSRPMGGWLDVWECMRSECREEVVLIEASTLLHTLENYLRKHRFCTECRSKVLRAYTLLVEETDPCREKGYLPSLYAGIKRCVPEKHIHLQCRTDFIAHLITRAEPELIGSRRERHAKTLEIAQEEVLTCLGLCVYERLHRIQQRLREEEQTCQILTAVSVEALRRNFEMAVEMKRGISELELLFEEITKEELARQQRKEHKKQKRKKKKEKKAEHDEKENNCELQVLDMKNKCSLCFCENCQQKKELASTELVATEDSEKERSTKRKEAQNGDSLKRKSGTASKCGCDGGDSSTNVSSSSSSSPQFSLSPCQSCKNAQASTFNGGTRSRGDGGGSGANVGGGCWSSRCSSSEHSQDCGYSSENNNEIGSGSCSLPSSPEGSEVACSEGFCNHEGDCTADGSVECRGCESVRNRNNITSNIKGPGGLTLSLQQMLEESYSSDDDEGSFIPVEEVRAFKAQMRHLTEKRQELRKTLRQRFAQLCVNAPASCPVLRQEH